MIDFSKDMRLYVVLNDQNNNLKVVPRRDLPDNEIPVYSAGYTAYVRYCERTEYKWVQQ